MGGNVSNVGSNFSSVALLTGAGIVGGAVATALTQQSQPNPKVVVISSGQGSQYSQVPQGFVPYPSPAATQIISTQPQQSSGPNFLGTLINLGLLAAGALGLSKLISSPRTFNKMFKEHFAAITSKLPEGPREAFTKWAEKGFAKEHIPAGEDWSKIPDALVKTLFAEEGSAEAAAGTNSTSSVKGIFKDLVEKSSVKYVVGTRDELLQALTSINDPALASNLKAEIEAKFPQDAPADKRFAVGFSSHKDESGIVGIQGFVIEPKPHDGFLTEKDILLGIEHSLSNLLNSVESTAQGSPAKSTLEDLVKNMEARSIRTLPEEKGEFKAFEVKPFTVKPGPRKISIE